MFLTVFVCVFRLSRSLVTSRTFSLNVGYSDIINEVLLIYILPMFKMLVYYIEPEREKIFGMRTQSESRGITFLLWAK